MHRALAHPTLRALAENLAGRAAERAGDDGAPARAAVALAIRLGSAGDPELLLIRRATREGDPWSGQVALPGGRWSAADSSLQHTAMRETAEETGLDLSVNSLALGALDELRPRTPHLPPIIVTPYVWVTEAARPLVPNYEVAALFWMPLEQLRDPTRSRESAVHVRGATWRVPSFVFEEHVIWGMTERILRQLVSLLD